METGLVIFLTIILTLLGLLAIFGFILLFKSYKFYLANVNVLSQCANILNAMQQFRQQNTVCDVEEDEDAEETTGFGLNRG